MKLAIMQPYFFPYIGYFQLLDAVDHFIVYDNIQFSKKGWVQRNRILLEGKDYLFSLPLKNDSDFLNINQRFLADSYGKERDKILRVMKSAYSKAPYFTKAMPIIEDCFYFENRNLFDFVFYTFTKIKDYLEIKTNIVISSGIGMVEGLSGQNRVIELCRSMEADEYINAIGGQALYKKEDFSEFGIDLHFLKTRDFSYSQFGNEFIGNLSIIDLMMFNDIENIKEYLTYYSLV